MSLKPARYKKHVPLQRRMSWRHSRFMEFSKKAPPQELLIGDKGFYFHAVVVGPDLVVRGVLATWFGTALDKQDNGETASGVSTLKTPDVVGCALPMHGFGLAATEGSPLPRIPWFTKVRVGTPAGNWLDVPLIDLGPARYTNHGIDLTPVAFQKLGGTINKGILSVDYRVLGGAHYL